MSDVISFNKKAKFNPGDIVVLRSGSPNLCVRSYTPSKNRDQSGLVFVDWFSDGEHLADTFFESQLVFSSVSDEEIEE